MTVMRYRWRGSNRAWLPGGLLVATYLLAVVWPAGRALDRWAFAGRLDAGRHLVGGSKFALALITVPSLGAAVVVLVVTAWKGGRWPRGVAAVAALAGAGGSAELLKLVLPATPQAGTWWSGWGGGSFPSGHATLAAAVALGVLTVVSPVWRSRLSGPAVAFAVAVAAATVTAGWHRPSEAVGGVLLAVIWHLMLSRRQRGRPSGAVRWALLVPPGRLGRRGGWQVGVVASWVVVATLVLGSAALPPPAESIVEPAALVHLAALFAVVAACGVSMAWAIAVGADRPGWGTAGVAARRTGPASLLAG